MMETLMLDNWTRSLTEAFRNEVSPATAQIIDLLAANPGRIFSPEKLVERLALASKHTLNGRLAQVTKAAKKAGRRLVGHRPKRCQTW